ncbi:invasin [Serratia marcescens]|nr:invasin [Serratia marcescens]
MKFDKNKLMQFLATLLMSVFILAGISRADAADDEPKMQLSARPLSGTYLQNGTVIGHGTVSYSGAHSGFEVWLDAPQNGGRPGHYVIRGKHNASHLLHIRLEQEGWTTEEGSGKGIVTKTRENKVAFDIVADGSQDVLPDQYIMQARTGVIFP